MKLLKITAWTLLFASLLCSTACVVPGKNTKISSRKGKKTEMETSKICAEADFGKQHGKFNRKLHSSNTAPNLADRGILDLTEDYKKMNFTYTRTHDWPLWNAGQRVVDTHFIFPLMHLDPADPANYYFDATDEMIQAAQNAGSKVFYRLGTSIEHSGRLSRPEHRHFNSLPPTDYAKYAEVLAGIIRHYTCGWANGFKYDMQYWEIWNEAENNPTCWKGSYEEFIKFFVVVLKRLKQEFPELKIGGPAATRLREDLLRPLLRACREAGVAPDFISWHGYRSVPDDFAAEPAKAKAMLKEEGFPDCEIAITEWHYLISWKGIQGSMTPENRKNAVEGPAGIVGIDSAAFNLAALCAFQDTPLDMAFYYGANPRGNWGFYGTYGEYNKNYYSMVMYGQFLKVCTKRIYTEKQLGSVYLLGGLTADGEGRLLISDYRGSSDQLCVKILGMDKAEVSAERLDQTSGLAPVPVRYQDGILTLPKNGKGSAAFLISFKPR